MYCWMCDAVHARTDLVVAAFETGAVDRTVGGPTKDQHFHPHSNLAAGALVDTSPLDHTSGVRPLRHVCRSVRDRLLLEHSRTVPAPQTADSHRTEEGRRNTVALVIRRANSVSPVFVVALCSVVADVDLSVERLHSR